MRLKVALWRRREPKLSLREAAARLNDAKFFTFTGAPWTKGRLAQAVRRRVNPKYEPDVAMIAGALCLIADPELVTEERKAA